MAFSAGLRSASPVEIVNEPYKFGWASDGLYLEVHPTLEGDEHPDDHGMTQVTQLYVRATEARPAQVDWALVEEVYRAKLGIPVRVGVRRAGGRLRDRITPSRRFRAAPVTDAAQRTTEKYPKK